MVRRRVIAPAALAALLALGAPATAEIKLKDYRELYLSGTDPGARQLIEDYLSGVRDGLLLGDATWSRWHKGFARFCHPEGTDLSTAGFIKLLNRKVLEGGSQGPWPDDIPLVAIVMVMMRDYFPCK